MSASGLLGSLESTGIGKLEACISAPTALLGSVCMIYAAGSVLGSASGRAAIRPPSSSFSWRVLPNFDHGENRILGLSFDRLATSRGSS